jgi:hypothetical protein
MIDVIGRENFGGSGKDEMGVCEKCKSSKRKFLSPRYCVFQSELGSMRRFQMSLLYERKRK